MAPVESSRADACAAANDDESDYLAGLIREDEAFICRIKRIFYRGGGDSSAATKGWEEVSTT